VAGLPRTVTITSEEIREALSEPIAAIVNAVKSTLERTPPELAADLVDSGIVMAGGGSQLNGLDRLLHQETGLQVRVADNPETAIVLGSGKYLEEIGFLQSVNGYRKLRK
jgi:rod shape-determining protein MreB